MVKGIKISDGKPMHEPIEVKFGSVHTLIPERSPKFARMSLTEKEPPQKREIDFKKVESRLAKVIKKLAKLVISVFWLEVTYQAVTHYILPMLDPDTISYNFLKFCTDYCAFALDIVRALFGSVVQFVRGIVNGFHFDFSSVELRWKWTEFDFQQMINQIILLIKMF